MDKLAKNIPTPVLVFALSVFLIGGAGPNVLYAIVALLVLVAGAVLLWRPGEPPVLMLVFAVQWLQASILIFYANMLGVPISEVSQLSNSVPDATLLSLMGLFIFSAALRIGIGSAPLDVAGEGVAAARQWGPGRYLTLYVMALLVAIFASTVAWRIPGLAQPLLVIAGWRWVLFWIFAYVCFVRGEGYIGLIIVVLVEIAWGLSGVFSDFKQVLLICLLAAAAANVKLTVRRTLVMASIMALLVFLGVVWTAVKFQYRDFLNQSYVSQTSLTLGERAQKLGELGANLNENDLVSASGKLVHRLSYVEFFGASMDYVPRAVPHSNGAIWLDALSRPFMPRLLFPKKTTIDDSQRTNQYTGLGVSGAESGTSISIGYLGESYIDFGTMLMMAPICLLGLALGATYRFALKWRRAGAMVGMGLAVSILMEFLFAETSITKSWGGYVATLVFAPVLVVGVLPIVAPWLVGRASRVARAQVT